MSGIYIPNKRMPKGCWECDFGADGVCLAMTPMRTRDWAEKDTTNHCPLVPVPPHGDLIERDELLTHRFVGVVGESEKSSYMVGWNSAIEAIVENAETIIGGE